jgi:1-acyl-sn-glycerol-3-phosphate acyltransferase
LLQAAIAAQAPILPVALCFTDAASGGRSLAPCYIDDDTLVGSIWRTLTAPPLCAVVRFGECQFSEGRDRRAWAVDLRATIEQMRA